MLRCKQRRRFSLGLIWLLTLCIEMYIIYLAKYYYLAMRILFGSVSPSLCPGRVYMKKWKLILLMLLIAAVSVGMLTACKNNLNAAASIRIKDSIVYLAPTGTYSKYQLEPEVLPSDAADKRLIYSVVKAEDAQYLTVSQTGLLTALGKEKEEAVTVRIKSASNPDVYLDITVYILVAEVKRISFSMNSLELTLGTPKKVTPVITPYYAEEGANLGYEILDPTIATVDAYGNVTPLKSGATTIRIYTITDFAEDMKQAFLPIYVVYSPLNYQIKIRGNKTWVLKQINNDEGYESFWIDVWKEADDPCDPNPQISWYVNDSKIPNSSLEGKFSINFEPSLYASAPTTYEIKAVLRSGSTQVQELILPTLTVYAPLTTFNVRNMTIKESYEINDTIKLIATHGTGQYPPDSYNWYIKDASNPDAQPVFLESTSPVVETAGAAPSGVYNYNVDRLGEYRLICYAVVKGVETMSVEVPLGNFEASAVGNDIYGIYVDGANLNGTYVPYVKWDPLPYDSDMEIQVRNIDSNLQYSMTTDSHPNHFTRNGVYIPENFVNLNESFSVKVKSERYGFTDWVTYSAGSIAEEHYEYLDTFYGDYNSYIVNMEELGEILNFVSLFRPEALKKAGTENSYNLTLCVPFAYAAVSSVYPSGGTSASTDPAEVNAFNLISAAFICYGDTARFSMGYNHIEISGEISITLTFPTDVNTALVPSPVNENEEYPFAAHYTKTPRSSGAALPIDANGDTLSVTTSNQLYYAVSLGFKPLPTAGSPAETVYQIARDVLRRIISDGMNEAEKVHAIYDFLSLEVLYDYELLALSDEENINDYEGFYLEGVFLRGSAVCDGIAKAFNLLCRMEGIASKKISGYVVRNSTQIGHAWNTVNVLGQWYVTDATWGSALNNGSNKELQTHRYLLTTDAVINEAHYTYGVYPASASEQYPVYTNYPISENIAPRASSDGDIEAIADYLLTILNGAPTEVLFEIFVTPAYLLSMGGSLQLTSYLQNTLASAVSGNLLGISISNMGGGYVVIRFVEA